MPINVTLSADELKALLAMREEHAALQREREELRSTLRLVTAERDLAEERLQLISIIPFVESQLVDVMTGPMANPRPKRRIKAKPIRTPSLSSAMPFAVLSTEGSSRRRSSPLACEDSSARRAASLAHSGRNRRPFVGKNSGA